MRKPGSCWGLAKRLAAEMAEDAPQTGPPFRTMRVRGAAVLQAPGSTPSHPSKFSLRGPKGCMSLPGPGGSVTMSLLLSSPSTTWVRRANPRLRAGGALDGGAETLSHPEEEDRGPVGTPPPRLL